MQIYNNKKKSEGIFPMEIGVIPIPIDVRSNSLPFPFTIPNWSIVPIPVEFQFDSYWESHSHRLISSMVHSRQWWLRRCSSLTGSSNWKSTRQMMWPTHNRALSWELDSTSNSRATRYGPNSVMGRSTANRMPTANMQHLKPHSTSWTSCKLVGNPSCQLVGKLVVSCDLVGNYTVSQKTMTPNYCS